MEFLTDLVEPGDVGAGSWRPEGSVLKMMSCSWGWER
jgi:hypothetical protein